MSKQFETPVLVDTYGTKPPRAAKVSKGVGDLAGAQTAQDTRYHASPGTYRKRDPDRDDRASLQTLLIALDASLKL